jgi:hypothetical protein
MVLVESRGPGSSTELVFESNFDTDIEAILGARLAHLDQLATRIGPELRSVFEHCEAFSPGGSTTQLAAYLAKRLHVSTARYQGHADRTLGRIQLERRIRDLVMTFLESAPRAPQRELYDHIRGHLRRRASEDPTLTGFDVDSPAPEPPSAAARTEALAHQIWPWIKNAYLALPLVGHVGDILATDATDEQFDHQKWQESWTEQDLERFRAVAASEDHGLQNALTHVVPLRPGKHRADILRTAHTYIDRLAKEHFNHVGQLGGIPSIHFAQWMLLDDDRLLFLSNYDNSWESYLGDFVDQAAVGLNLAWACTELFPKTHLLAIGGANDEERFKAWTRAYQVPTQVFYSGYPDLSIAAINNNTWIRYGLHAPGTTDLEAWFRRLS